MGLAKRLCAAPTLAMAAALALAHPGETWSASASEIELHGPRRIATGLPIALKGSGVAPSQVVVVERRVPNRWQRIGSVTADAQGRFAFNYRPTRLSRRYVIRARLDPATASPEVRIRSRDVSLLAVGDVNLGNGPATVMARRGRRWPWGSVAPVLRRGDIAMANLECAVSTRGSPVPKEYNFRGRPGALRVARRYAGLDVLNLANNHVGDYGTQALLDTVRNVRGFGMVPVGAGFNSTAAHRPRIVERLGLRVAFVGFSDIGPASFQAGSHKPGTAFASVDAIRRDVAAAKQDADVVVATFHWGIERATRENERQRVFAGVAISAGADAVIGAHPHVLQPVRRPGKHRVVAYSLGNFVWSAGSAGTARTGILKLRLSAAGVEGVRLLPARIVDTRPRLVGG